MPQGVFGIDIADLALPVKEAIRLAGEQGFRAIELPGAAEEIAPETLGASARRHLKKYVEQCDCSIAAIAADFAGLRLTDPRSADERIERTCRIMDMARDVGVRTVTASVGALTHPDSGEPSPLALSALRRIGEFADSRGVVFAMRPSHDADGRLARLLEEVACASLQICIDPAAMVMVGINPAPLLERFANQIALVHARDATAGLGDRSGQETPLGDGDVDLPGLLRQLADIDYRAPYIIRRTNSDTPLRDLLAGREHLERWLRLRQ